MRVQDSYLVTMSSVVKHIKFHIPVELRYKLYKLYSKFSRPAQVRL